ncbi:MAG TPA: DUF2332 domain-containing protein [Gaiellaceae bacterium]|nr:DUF2332 domain-containing protein [Gaiellaceae bacterium]
MCRQLAADPRVAALTEEPRWDLPLRLLAGLHYLVLSRRATWDDLGLDEHAAFLQKFCAEQDVQTNEVQRSWALVPAFLSLADHRPFDMLELGPSGGLNLVWDRYRCVYSTGTWGSGALELRGDDCTPPPASFFSLPVTVARRRGVDLNPVDVTTDEGSLLLQSFVWADQAERLARLRTAIDIVRADPPELIRGDYVRDLPQLLADRVPGAQLVVYETASTQYLYREQRDALYEAMHDAGRREPFTFLTTLSNGGEDHYTFERVDWPSGARRAIEHFDFHGGWLRWL